MYSFLIYFLKFLFKFQLVNIQCMLISGIECNHPSLTYNSQCSSQKVPSSIPITHPRLPHQPSVCSQFLKVSYVLALSHSNLFFFFPSLPPWVPVKFLRIHIRVKPYGICLSLYGLFHLASHSPVLSTLLQKAIFRSFSLPRSIPLCI